MKLRHTAAGALLLFLLCTLPLAAFAAPTEESTVETTETQETTTAPEKLPGQVSVSQGSIIYGKETLSPVITSETHETIPSPEYKLQGAPDDTYTAVPPETPGVYTLRITCPETETHLSCQETVDFTIRAPVIGVTLIAPEVTPSRTYNGLTEPAPTADLVFSFQAEGTSQKPQPGQDYNAVITLNSPLVTQDPATQNLEVTLQFLEGLFVPDPELSLTFTLHADILKAPLTLTALDQATPEGYSQDLTQVTAEGLLEGHSLSALTMTLDPETDTLDLSDPKILAGEEDVTDQYDIRLQSGRLTHSAAMTDYPVAAQNLTYNGKPQPLLSAPGEALNGTMVYALSYHSSQSSPVETLSDWSEDLPTGRAPGIYEVKFKAQGGELQDSDEKSLMVILAPRVLEVSAFAEKVYDGTKAADPETVAIQILEGSILPGDDVVIKSLEGSFPQIGAGLDLKLVPGNAVLEGEDASAYSIKIRSFTGNILKRPAKVQPLDQKKAYGQSDPKLSYTAEGVLPGEQLTGSLTRSPGEDRGSYHILPGTLTAENNPNYDLTVSPAKLQIRPAQQDFSLELHKNRLRPGKILNLTVTAKNSETDLMDSGWNQPQKILLQVEGQTLEPESDGAGTWTASCQVPKNAPGILEITASSQDRNYHREDDYKELTVTRFLSNPPTGDQILAYGTLFALSLLSLIGIIAWYFSHKKK